MNDDDLRRRFTELRREDAKDAPPFEQLTRRRPAGRLRVLFAAVPVIAAAAVLVVWCGPAARRSAPVAVQPPRARVHHAAAALPLDFLLESAPARVRLDIDPTQEFRP